MSWNLLDKVGHFVTGLKRRAMLAVQVVAVLAIVIWPVNLAGAADVPHRTVHHPITVRGPGISPNVSGYTVSAQTPVSIRKAYGIDQIAGTGAGKTIAIVDAFGSPTIVADLQTFSQQFGLPAANLTVAYTDTPTGTDSSGGWALETTLDVEWAHAIAPGASILLVVAKNDSDNYMMNAVNYATNHGATVVSMSWGAPEFSTEASYDSYFNHSGITYVASSGDSGAGVSWPAVSSYVVGVGGTTLNTASDGTYISETAWSGSGGGQSAYLNKPGYQSGFQTSSKRGVPDVAFDADPSSGVAVYDSTPYGSSGGWFIVGGTSLSAPCWAALYTLGNQSGPAWLYTQASSPATYANNYHDITSGRNGTPNYPAQTGYDFVTGLGSPKANYLVGGAIEDLLTNGSFENGNPPAGWSATQWGSSITLSRDSTKSHSGSYSLKVVKSGNSNDGAGQAFSSSLIGQVCTLGAWVWSDTPGMAAVSIHGFSSAMHPGDSQWHYLTCTGQVWNATAYMYLTPGTGTAYFDDAVLSVNNNLTATKLAFTTQPGVSNTTGMGFGTQPVVTIQDAGGNTVTTSNAPLTLAITTGTGTSGAVLSGSATVNAVNGVATFSGLSINLAGTGYTLTATSTGLTSATSTGFNVSANLLTNGGFENGNPPAGWSATQWGSSITLSQDSTKSHSGSYSLKVVKSGNSNDGAGQAFSSSLIGQVCILGVWVWSDTPGLAAVSIHGFSSAMHPGDSQWHYLTCTGQVWNATAYMYLTPGTGTAYFDDAVLSVNNNLTATKLAFTTQPGVSNTTGMGFGTQPVVTIQDASGNTVTSSNAPVTLVITAGSGTSGAVLSGTATVNAINGVANFSGLSIDLAGTGYSLTASSTGLTSATSAAFNVSANLLTNGGFENSNPPAGWSATQWGSSIALSRDSTKSHSGSYSLKVVKSGNSNDGAGQTFSSSLIGQVCTLGAWVWCDTPGLAAVSIHGFSSALHPGDSQWHYLSCTGQVWNSTAYMYLVPGTGTAYFDDAVLSIGQ